MRIGRLLLLLVLAPCGLYAQSLFVERVDVTNLGIYELAIKNRTDDKNLTGGVRNRVANMRNIRATTTIPARLCISFGFEYVIAGAPSSAEVPIKIVTRFPSQGVYNPDTRVTTFTQKTLVKRAIGKPHFRSYTLEKQWEVVPGVWTFELWYQNRKLVEQSFTLDQSCATGCDGAEPHQATCEASLIALAT